MIFSLGWKTYLALVNILLGTYSPLVAIETSSYVHLPQFDDLLHRTFVIDGLHPVASLAVCAVLCASQAECGSFFVINLEGQMSCQTHSLLFTSSEEVEVIIGTRYYQLHQDWCPQGQGYILNRKLSLCYRYVDYEQTWESAERSCEEEGGHLMWITSQEVADHLKNFILSNPGRRGRHVFVGTLMTNGQDWTLTDGSRVTFTDWAEGEPSSSSENCVAMAWFYNFRWNDAPCSGYSWPSLCQRVAV